MTKHHELNHYVGHFPRNLATELRLLSLPLSRVVSFVGLCPSPPQFAGPRITHVSPGLPQVVFPWHTPRDELQERWMGSSWLGLERRSTFMSATPLSL